jgi:hypothetical protein
MNITESDIEAGGPAYYDLHVNWSIYVRCSDKGSLRRTHMPPIEHIIKNPAIPFQMFKEESNLGLFRVVIYQNYPRALIKETIPEILATAYSLANTWSIGGLGCLATETYNYVYGVWTMNKPSPRPPNLESMMFEIGLGLVRELTADGGVMVDAFEKFDGTGHTI